MKVNIVSPSKNPMQSGTQSMGKWQIVFPPESRPTIDGLNGWIGMEDTNQQLKLLFASRDKAIEYASRNNLQFEIVEPKQRLVKPKSYSANFAFKQENRA